MDVRFGDEILGDEQLVTAKVTLGDRERLKY